jgi:hypothetical protein
MMDMEQFYTRDKANEGIKIPLVTPDNKETEHWLLIRGADSDAFRDAENEAKRAIIRAAKDDEVKVADAAKEGALDLLAAVVKDWSFPQECSGENIKEFLLKAPQIGDRIDKVLADRSFFFAVKSTGSSTTPEKNSSSGRKSKATRKKST